MGAASSVDTGAPGTTRDEETALIRGLESGISQAINTCVAAHPEWRQAPPTVSHVMQSIAEGMLATAEKAQAAESANNKLAELRRLTPEQEAAAAKAAQRIGEVAAAAEAAPEEERAAAINPFVGQELWAFCGGGAIEPLLEHTPLIDLEYLVALAEGGGVMPCGRQNVPPAAFITAQNLWRLRPPSTIRPPQRPQRPAHCGQGLQLHRVHTCTARAAGDPPSRRARVSLSNSSKRRHVCAHALLSLSAPMRDPSSVTRRLEHTLQRKRRRIESFKRDSTHQRHNTHT